MLRPVILSQGLTSSLWLGMRTMTRIQRSRIAKRRPPQSGLTGIPKGHSLKLGINRVHTTYESAVDLANDSSKDVYQVQGQFYF